MKIFSRDFWGTVLIWLGVIVFLVVIYDIIRPVFPGHPPYPLIRSIQSFFSRGPQPRPRPPSPSARRAEAARRPIPGDSRMLTSGVFSPGDQYHQWVWAVKPDHQTGKTVQVEAAHAAQGPAGGFFIVAYADGDGDGKPDRKAAESEFLTAGGYGQWSAFTFSVGEEALFVGLAWREDQEAVTFRGNGDWPEEDFPLEGRFYYLIDGSNSRSAGPAHTNLRVSFSD